MNVISIEITILRSLKGRKFRYLVRDITDKTKLIISDLLQEKFDDDELNEMLEDLKTFKDFQ